MNFKKILISAALLLVALVTRMVQIFNVIDYKTGFYKEDHAVMGVILTAVVFVLCFASAIVSRTGLKVKKAKSGFVLPVVSALTSFALIYELIVEKFVIQGLSWQVVFMKIAGFAAAAYFILLAIKDFLKVEIPDLVHTIPAFYMIIRIVCSFINISSLSLIAENIFFVTALCCALLFFVSYAAFYCLNENNKMLNFRSVLALSFCCVTSLANVIANIVINSGYSHIPFHSQLVVLMLTFFIGVFTFGSVLKSRE